MQNQNESPMEIQKHSGFGIASFTISLIVAFLIFIALIYVLYMDATSMGGVDEKSPLVIILGLLIFLLLLADIVAVGFGIAAFFHKDRKKIFAILGLIFSGATLIGTVGLIIIGNLSK